MAGLSSAIASVIGLSGPCQLQAGRGGAAAEAPPALPSSEPHAARIAARPGTATPVMAARRRNLAVE